MNPLFARNRISDFLDNELSTEELHHFKAAMDTSPSLQQEVNEIRAAQQIFRREAPSVAPAILIEDVMNAIQSENLSPIKKAEHSKTPYFIWTSAFAAAAMFGLILMPNDPQIEPEAQLGSVLEVTRPVEMILPVNVPSAYELLEDHHPVNVEPSPISEATVEEPQEGLTESRMPTVSFVPTTPYTPDWEEENVFTSSPAGNDSVYLIRFATPNALFQLEAVAQRYDGQFQNNTGEPIKAYILNNENNFASVEIIAPLSQWQKIDEALRHLNAEFGHQLVFEEQDIAKFSIEVSFNP